MPVYKDETGTKDGRKFYFIVSYKDIDGKYRNYKSVKYLTKRQASLAESKYMLSLGINKNSNITFNYVINELLVEKKDRLKPQSYLKAENVYKHISKTLGKIKIAKMSSQDYMLFRKSLSDNLSINFSNKINNSLKSLIRYANDKYGTGNTVIFTSRPFTDPMAKKKEMDFFTYDEFMLFIKQIKDIRFKSFFTTLFFMGLRSGEANALTWNDLKDDNIDINKTVTTKMIIDGDYLITSPKTKSSYRTLPMPEVVKSVLKELKEYYSSFEDFDSSWRLYGGLKSLPESTIQKAKNDACDKAGLRHIRIHDFRHSCASFLINHGANITLVSKYLGHASVSVTLNVYSHMYQSELTGIVSEINKMNIILT